MKTITLLTLMLCINTLLFSQTTTKNIEINISGRVDTADTDVNNIYGTLKAYLSNRPDSLFDNPYWNSREKKLDTLSNPSLFYKAFSSLEMSPEDIFNHWKPFVLSIEKVNDLKYAIRLAFIKDKNEPDKILTIIKLNAVMEGQNWVLENIIGDIEKDWNIKYYKNIKYVYSQTYQFNESLAVKATNFCDSISSRLNINYTDTFTYYICSNPDELGLLLGFEFFYLNYTTGITNKSLKQIFAANRNEYYPHEFVHILLGESNPNINYIIEEGLACFLGEYQSAKYIFTNTRLANDYFNSNTKLKVHDLINNNNLYLNYSVAYPVGSIIAELVYEKLGYDGIIKLSKMNTQTTDDIYNSLCKLLKCNKSTFEKQFENKLAQYKGNQ